MQTHRYQQIADRLERQIRNGHFQPGERLPSLRQMCRQESVSLGTLVQAYDLLESRGLIRARPQSGFFIAESDRQPALPAVSAPADDPVAVSVGELSLQVVRASASASQTPLGPAYPSCHFSGCRSIRQTIAARARQPQAPFGHYADPTGDPELRRQLARRAQDAGCELSADQLLVTSGCQEAISLCLQAVTRPGDTIAVESPVFYGTLQVIEALGLKALEIPTHPETGISPQALAQALSRWPVRACLLSPTVSNPLGSVMPDSHKQQVLQILAEKDLPLVEDDVFGELHFGQRRPRAIKAWDRDGRVLWCSSVSKTLDPDLRVGWVSAGRYHSRVASLKFVSTMASPGLLQSAVADHLARGGFERHLRQIRSYYRGRRDRMIALIRELFPAETRHTRPSGGFLLWLQLPEECDTMVLYQRALEAGISIAPGPLFSARERYRNCIRLNYAFNDDQRVSGAIRTLAGLLD